MKLIYLAGAVTGVTYEDAVIWREYVMERLPRGIRCINPIPPDVLVGAVGRIQTPAELYGIIARRSYWFVQQCDVVLANLLIVPPSGVSIGTVAEIGAANALRRLLVVVLQPASAYDHPLITDGAVVTNTIEAAVAAVKDVLYE